MAAVKDKPKPKPNLADEPLDVMPIRTIMAAVRQWVKDGKPYKR